MCVCVCVYLENERGRDRFQFWHLSFDRVKSGDWAQEVALFSLNENPHFLNYFNAPLRSSIREGSFVLMEKTSGGTTRLVGS